MLEKGRLYFFRKDGSKGSMPLSIKQKIFLFGSSDCCTVRIYIDGVFPKHCVLTVEDQGKAYLEPLHPSALTLVNGTKIKRKICLKNSDVVTIIGKEFQFSYPPNSLPSNVPIKSLLTVPFSKQAYLKPLHPSALTLVNGPKLKQKICLKNNNVVPIFEKEFQYAYPPSSLPSNVPIERLFGEPFSKQMKSPQNFEIFTVEKNWKTLPSFRECEVANLKLISVIESDIFKEIPEYLLKYTHQECVSISYENINAQVADFSCNDNHLMEYMNRYAGESFESKKKLALKLYEFFSFIIMILSRSEECICDLLTVLKPVWKYSIARASEDVLFLPFKHLYFKYLNQGEITVHKKSLQSGILLHSSKEMSTNSRECKVANLNYIPKKFIFMIESGIFRSFSEYLLKFSHYEYVSFTFENINTQEVNISATDKPLMKYMGQYVGESIESRKNLALKLYEFFSFIKELHNRNEECRFDSLPVLQYVCKYSITKASEDILFLPLKPLYLKYLNQGEITVNKKSLLSSILPLSAKNLSPNSETISKREQKQNQNSSRRISTSYRKRVSLAVKRYQLRKRKSMMMAKSAVEIGNENLVSAEQEISVEAVHYTIGKEIIPAEPTKGKRRNKKATKKTDFEQYISLEAVHDTVGKENIPVEPSKEKQRNKKTAEKKTDLGLQTKSLDYSGGEQLTSTKPTKSKESCKRKKKEASTIKTALNEGIEKNFTHDTSGKQQNILEPSQPKTKKGNYKKKKEVVLEKDKSTQDWDKQEPLHSQRITRSMTKNRH